MCRIRSLSPSTIQPSNPPTLSPLHPLTRLLLLARRKMTVRLDTDFHAIRSHLRYASQMECPKRFEAF